VPSLFIDLTPSRPPLPERAGEAKSHMCIKPLPPRGRGLGRGQFFWEKWKTDEVDKIEDHRGKT